MGILGGSWNFVHSWQQRFCPTSIYIYILKWFWYLINLICLKPRIYFTWICAKSRGKSNSSRTNIEDWCFFAGLLGESCPWTHVTDVTYVTSQIGTGRSRSKPPRASWRSANLSPRRPKSHTSSDDKTDKAHTSFLTVSQQQLTVWNATSSTQASCTLYKSHTG